MQHANYQQESCSKLKVTMWLRFGSSILFRFDRAYPDGLLQRFQQQLHVLARRVVTHQPDPPDLAGQIAKPARHLDTVSARKTRRVVRCENTLIVACITS